LLRPTGQRLPATHFGHSPRCASATAKRSWRMPWRGARAST
jgi:hypothetical protein